MTKNGAPMRHLVTLVAVAGGLFALSLLPYASAGTPIPGTNVQVVELGPTSKTISFGSATNFSWAVYNGGPATYSMNVTANVSDPTFRMELYPSSFAIARDELRE